MFLQYFYAMVLFVCCQRVSEEHANAAVVVTGHESNMQRK